jgi:hypothetical protein
LNGAPPRGVRAFIGCRGRERIARDVHPESALSRDLATPGAGRRQAERHSATSDEAEVVWCDEAEIGFVPCEV